MYRPIADTTPRPVATHESIAPEGAGAGGVAPRAGWSISPRSMAVGATVLAAALAAFRLGHKSYWLDEGYSIGHARLPWDQFWSVLVHREPNGALHSLVLFGLIRVSNAEWWLRLPTAVCAVASVPLLYCLLRRLFDERVGAVGAVLLALNAYSLQFAQEARPYAVLMFASTASTLAFVAFLQDGRRSQWWAWVAVSAILPYTHLFGWPILGVQAVGGLVLRPGLPTPARRLLGGFVAIGVATCALAVVIALADQGGQAEGIPGVSAVRFIGVYARAAGDGGIVLLALVALVWLHVAATFGRELWPLHPFRPTERQWAFLYLVAWLVLPTIAIALLSPIQPLFGARYFVILVPATVALTALGLVTIADRRLRAAATVLVLALTLSSTVSWYQRPAADDLRSASETIGQSVELGDAVVFLPWFMELPFDPYAQRDARLGDDLQSTWPDATWGRFLPDHRDHPTPDEIAATVSARDRVWIVVRQDRVPADDHDLDAYQRELARDHREVLRAELGGVDVVLYERR